MSLQNRALSTVIDNLSNSELDKLKSEIRVDPKYRLHQKFRNGIFLLVLASDSGICPDYSQLITAVRDLGLELKELTIPSGRDGISEELLNKLQYPSQLREDVGHYPFLAMYTRESWLSHKLEGHIYPNRIKSGFVESKLLPFLSACWI